MKLHKLIVLISLLAIPIGCSKKENARTISVLFDITERSSGDFNKKDLSRVLFHLGGLAKNNVSHHEVCYSITLISDLTTNVTVGDCLQEDAGRIERSTGKRLKDIAQFEDTIHQDFVTMIEEIDSLGRRKSQVYRSLQRAIQNFKNESGEKILLVFSDLLHNKDQFSFYFIEKDFIKLTEPLFDSIYSSLSHRYPLPQELSDITIIVIHQPKQDTDEVYELAKWWWQELIESRGGRIEFYSTVEELIYLFDPKIKAL